MLQHICARSIFAIIEAQILVVIGGLLLLLGKVYSQYCIIRSNHFGLRLLIILIMVDIALSITINYELLDTTHRTIRQTI